MSSFDPGPSEYLWCHRCDHEYREGELRTHFSDHHKPLDPEAAASLEEDWDWGRNDGYTDGAFRDPYMHIWREDKYSDWGAFQDPSRE